MAFDLGISHYISKGTKADPGNQYDTTELTAAETIDLLSSNQGWSIARALAWSNDPKLPTQPNERFENNQQAALKDFLSLYSVTRDDYGLSPGDAGPPSPTPTVGSRASLNIVNGSDKKELIRTALFGDGTKAGGLISQVLIGGTTTVTAKSPGQNPLVNIRNVLTNLGITNSNSRDHQNHFHVYLKPPKLLGIDPNARNLEVDVEATSAQRDISASDLSDLQVAAQAMLSGLQVPIQPEEEIMFAIDIPYVPAQEVQATLVAQATSVTNAKDNPRQADSKAQGTHRKEVTEYCQDVDNISMPGGSAFNSLPVLNKVLFSLGYRWDNKKGSFNAPPAVIASIRNSKVTIIESPQHGAVERLTPNSHAWKYTAEPEYVGKDRVVFLVEAQGRRFKIVANLLVHHVVPEYDLDEPPACEEVFPKGDAPIDPSFEQKMGTAALPSWLRSASLIPSNYTVTFGNLPGNAVGNTAGTSITLDTNAAGHDWFIDATPDQHEEFLPTAKPNEWIAKPGGAAEGKMDMLSVLLHEYGHVLGIEHSDDSHSLMSTTLQPGMRRTLSAEDLAAFQGALPLLASNQGDDRHDHDPHSPDTPLPPNQRRASARVARSSRGTGGMCGTQDEASSQYLTAANPTLQNGSLSSNEGWTKQGGVTLANHSAMLSERADSQSVLRQIFAVGEGDNFLRFTVSAQDLRQAGGPSDAFEVALLNADTGAALETIDGLTRGDAFLNIQSRDGARAGDMVHTRINADGSKTYTLDLTGVARGTPVLLSFDLLGFGDQDSQVTVRDIKLLKDFIENTAPEANNDAATINEDASVSINVLANDTDAQNDPLTVILDSEPQHGKLVKNNDGSFAYTPEENFFGTDTFTYRLNDGSLDSAVAQVTITVGPVNDVPIVSDVQATTVEDAPLSLDLVAQGQDVDSALLTPVIAGGPASGVVTINADGTATYTSNANFNGTDSFTFRLNDGMADSNTATVHVTVPAANDAAVALDDEVAATEDTAVRINVMANDSDVDSTVLDTALAAPPLHGTVVKNADGSFTYTPDTDFFGTDSSGHDKPE